MRLAAREPGVGYLVVRGDPAWGVPASVVIGVLPAAEWTGAPPLTIGELLGVVRDDAGPQAARVVVLAGARGRIAVRADGQLRAVDLAPGRVQPVPALVAGHTKRVLAGVVLEGEGERTLILDVAALAAARLRAGETRE